VLFLSLPLDFPLNLPLFGMDNYVSDFWFKRIGEDERIIEYYQELVEKYKEYKAIPSSFRGPIFVPIDLTYRCNLRCSYCYVASPEKTDELDTKELKNVIDDLVKMKMFGLCFCGGEPTIREDFFYLLEYAVSKGLYVNAVSNGTLITDSFAKRLKETGIFSIQISIDGSNKEIHDRLRGEHSFNKAIGAVKSLVKAEIPVSISFACTKLNITNFPKVVDLAEKLGATWVRTQYLVPTGRGAEFIPPNEEYDNIKEFVLNEKINAKRKVLVEFGDPVEHIKILPLFPNFTFSITPDGWILPSPYLTYAFGNVRKDSIIKYWEKGLNKIWQNPIMLKISKEIHTEHDFVKANRVSADGKYYYTDLSDDLVD